ncbi:hypothetical protein [Mycoplasmopsis bovis]|uniref:hypothetical protein n=1 Tax=Mycoplasmopsis bovis TaxID=28903 RepID=UPI0027AA7F9C|nr:hypothetical protein HYD41_04405 [Mycoplasmopsis bovis]
MIVFSIFSYSASISFLKYFLTPSSKISEIDSLSSYNDELQESWQTYQILLELLTEEKVT